MSYPLLVFGPSGEQFSNYGATQRWPMGTQLILQDGRKFRFCRNGGVAQVAGSVYQAAANTGNHIQQVQTSGAASLIGDTKVTHNVGATAVTANDYDEGYWAVTAGTGLGQVNKIATHDASGGSGNIFCYFATGDKVQTAHATTSTASIVRHPYKQVIIYPTTSTGVHVGVAVIALAISANGWLQTRGIAPVLTNGTVVLGDGVYVSATAAGSVSATTTTFAVAYTRIVGYVSQVAATATNSLIYLQIDG